MRLNAGEPIEEDGDLFGATVILASRISGLSAAGAVLVSETVRSRARTSTGVRFEDRGEQALKGVGEAVRVWLVLEQEVRYCSSPASPASASPVSYLSLRSTLRIGACRS